MKSMIAWVLMLTLTGCATMSPIAGSPTELQQRVAAGELLRPGDQVRITTADGNRHEFRVTSVSGYSIDGKQESILVKDIFAVEKREASIGGTVVLVMVTALAATALVAVAAVHHPGN